jgi:hypothetical protein
MDDACGLAQESDWFAEKRQVPCHLLARIPFDLDSATLAAHDCKHV